MTFDANALAAVAARLFSSVMTPLVVGGELRPGRVIGTHAALALGRHAPVLAAASDDTQAQRRVYAGRLAHARRLAPVDRLDLTATAAEWTLGAVVHDILQAANPGFDAPMRRAAAGRVLDLALATIDSVPDPASVRDALSRHAWFARIFAIARSDTTVSWWLGSRTFLGVEPPARLRAWPDVRRVRVAVARRPLLELAPLAFDRDSYVETVARLLSRTPFTDLATCTRREPHFGWTDPALALLATRAGMTIALRALARLPVADVDAALGRATRELFAQARDSVVRPALALLAQRALAAAQTQDGPDRADRRPSHFVREDAQTVATATNQAPSRSDAELARAIGAMLAREELERHVHPGWSERDRRALLASLEPAVRSEAARAARSLVQGSAPGLAQAVPA